MAFSPAFLAWLAIGVPKASISASGPTSVGIPTALGQKIPVGVGVFPCLGRLIVNPDNLRGVRYGDGKVVTDLVLGFCDTTLGGTVNLVSLRANDKFIHRTTTPVRTYPGHLKFYGGDQTAVNSLLNHYITNPTYWPNLAYCVLKNFDLGPYDNQIPTFVAELATTVESVAASATETTLNFGAPVDGANGIDTCVDKVRNHWYAFDYDFTANTQVIMTFDIASNVEISRAQITWAGGTVDEYFGYPVSLDGSDYVAVQFDDNIDGYMRLGLLNTVTGVIEDHLEPLQISGPVIGEYQPSFATLLQGNSASKYLIFSLSEGMPFGTDLNLIVTVADITGAAVDDTTVGGGTLTDVIHPFNNPLTTGYESNIQGFAVGTITNGLVDIYWTHQDPSGNQDQNLWKGTISEGGMVSAGIIYAAGTDLAGCVYDHSDDTIVLYRADGYFQKVDQSGSTIYTNDSGITTLKFGLRPYWSVGYFDWAAETGFGVAKDNTLDDIYSVDLSDGSIVEMVGGGDYNDGFDYMDTRSGLLASISGVTNPSISVRNLGADTVPLTNLQNMYTKLATYRGKFIAGDLAFSNFPGSECYGVVYENDKSLDSAEQDLNNLFDVKIVASDGKRKYVMAKRDGSFAVDKVIDSTGIIEGKDHDIVKTMGTDEQSLVACRITYTAKSRRFKQRTAEYRRPNGVYALTRSDRIEDINTSVVLSPSQAKRAAATKVYRSNYGLERYAFKVAPELFYLEPADIVQFTFDAYTIVGQINDAALSGSDFTQALDVTQYVQAIGSDFTAQDLNAPAISTDSLLTRLTYLNTPLLDLGDDLGGTGLRQYAMLSSYGWGTFQGATLYLSYDGEIFTPIGTKDDDNTPIVGAVASISQTPTVSATTDAVTTLTVDILSGDTDDVASITTSQLYDGNNQAVIGQPGRWTIIYYKTASVSGKTATISDIIWSSPHYQSYLDDIAVGDYFVLLQAGHHLRFAGDKMRLDETLFYKAGNDAVQLALMPTEAQTLYGGAEMPFPPLNLDGTISGADTVLTWDWRSRLNPIAILTGPADTVHGEDSLAFEIDIMSGSTVLRTLTATAATVIYSGSQAFADFGSVQSSLKIRVYQISDLVDRGYVAESTITLPAATYTADSSTTADTTLITADAA